MRGVGACSLTPVQGVRPGVGMSFAKQPPPSVRFCFCVTCVVIPGLPFSSRLPCRTNYPARTYIPTSIKCYCSILTTYVNKRRECSTGCTTYRESYRLLWHGLRANCLLLYYGTSVLYNLGSLWEWKTHYELGSCVCL